MNYSKRIDEPTSTMLQPVSFNEQLIISILQYYYSLQYRITPYTNYSKRIDEPTSTMLQPVSFNEQLISVLQSTVSYHSLWITVKIIDCCFNRKLRFIVTTDTVRTVIVIEGAVKLEFAVRTVRA